MFVHNEYSFLKNEIKFDSPLSSLEKWGTQCQPNLSIQVFKYSNIFLDYETYTIQLMINNTTCPNYNTYIYFPKSRGKPTDSRANLWRHPILV